MRLTALVAVPICAVLALRAARGAATFYYVSPAGSPSGTGSMKNPWSLQAALAHPAKIIPGDVIWLLPGVYGDPSGKTYFESALTGSPHRPIRVRQHGAGRAVIQGSLRISGAYTWYEGFEITSTITDRTGNPNGSSALRNGVDCWAPGTKLINLVIHDTAQGIGMWREAVDSEIYGNIVFNNGFQASDRGHGHGIYIQNREGIKEVTDNIIFNQFGIGVSAYATSLGFVQNLLLSGNIVFNNGSISQRRNADNILLAAGSGLDRIRIENNLTYHSPDANLGYSRLGWEFDKQNGSAIIRGNYWIGGQIAVMVNRWKSATFAQNVSYARDSIVVLLDYPLHERPGPYLWTENAYYGSGHFRLGARQRTWKEWRDESGRDQNSKFVASPPAGVWTFVRTNRYECGRAYIVIYNWDLVREVAIDASAVLKPGARYEIRDAQYLLGSPLVIGTYAGKPISVPLRFGPVTQPHGIVPNPPRHTGPLFVVLVLLTI